MPTTEQAIEQIELDYICDKCGIGKMRPDGYCLPSSPPKYPHTCDNVDCFNKDTFINIKYPVTAYRRTGEPKPHKG